MSDGKGKGVLNRRFGVGQARRGWLEKNNVLNTLLLQELRPLIQRTMSS